MDRKLATFQERILSAGPSSLGGRMTVVYSTAIYQPHRTQAMHRMMSLKCHLFITLPTFRDCDLLGIRCNSRRHNATILRNCFCSNHLDVYHVRFSLAPVSYHKMCWSLTGNTTLDPLSGNPHHANSMSQKHHLLTSKCFTSWVPCLFEAMVENLPCLMMSKISHRWEERF